MEYLKTIKYIRVDSHRRGSISPKQGTILIVLTLYKPSRGEYTQDFVY